MTATGASGERPDRDAESARVAEYVRTVGSLFSGIGGIDLGFERAGYRVIWQVESNPYASAVLARQWPDVPNLGDVTKIDWSEVERPHVLAGGFPCQPVSMAGRGLAQRDERWLWPEFERAIRQLRPDHVVVENVPGLLVRGMGDVLGDLASLGYDCEWESIPASAVGAPHLRWRVFIVAHPQRPRSQGHGGQHRLGEGGGEVEAGWGGAGSGAVGDPDSVTVRPGLCPPQPRRKRWGRPGDAGWWTTEPELGRVANGVPSRVDRLRCLGNAVVPQVAEYVAAHIDGHGRAEPHTGASS
jgi:DNA (cytosine-5)-methyltransferase 1